MQRKKRPTKRERKDPQAQNGHAAAHIHCIACGRHLDQAEFTATPATAKLLVCQHQSRFPACTDCEAAARRLISEHDRSGKPVASAAAWH
jgi:hypothetical protein